MPTPGIRRARRIGSFLLGVGIMAIVLASIFVLLSIRYTQTEGSPLTKRIVALSEDIKSCTSPEGECAKRNQQQTAKVIADLIAGNSAATKAIISAALSCQADGFTEQPAILRCVIERTKD